MKTVRCDAIRFNPTGDSPYQARASEDGHAVNISEGAFRSLLDSESALQHPWTWVVLPTASREYFWEFISR